MRKFVLIGVGALAVGLIAGCSSTPTSSTGQPFDNGSAGGSAGSAGSSSSGGGNSTAPYPAGPYGTAQGSIVQNEQFEGWTDPKSEGYNPNNFKVISFSDFYDPDGKKGNKLILLNASAYWCTVCQAEYNELPTDYTNKYKAEGVVFVGTLFEDANSNPAQPTDLVNWSKAYEVDFPMLLDPSFKLGQFFTADATPMNLVIDARTMKIVAKVLGGDLPTIWSDIDNALSQMN
jgi:thiol-disulfide isomerase/thioredoxin